MKKIYVLFALMVCFHFAYTQSQRMVLAEESTNTGCGPCASQNPAFDALLAANEDIVTSIKYHVWWPSPNDPFYLHNKPHNEVRNNYYGINGVPYALLDGVAYSGSSYFGAPANINQNNLNAAAAVPSPLEIQLEHYLTADEDTLFVNMLIECTENAIGSLVAHMGVVEREIHFTSAPGSNGEKDFYNVMKYMIPNAGGTIVNNFTAGEYIILQGFWETANVYNMDQLMVVGFVQNNMSKSVLQAGNSSTDPITPPYSYDADVTELMDVAAANCDGAVNPSIIIRNNGAETLTSLDIKYYVNEEEPMVYNWTGSLDFLETELVELPELTFIVEDMNVLNIVTENPSGQPDEYLLNDTTSMLVWEAYASMNNVSLTMRLDDYPEETSWEIVNGEGTVLYEGGNYTTAGQFIQESFEFTDEECYYFNIYDEGGDGFTGAGFFTLHVGSTTLLQGTSFGSHDFTQFSYYTGVGVEDVDNLWGVNVYPNPANTRLNIEFSLVDSGEISFYMTDLAGRSVNMFENQEYGFGLNILELDLSDVPNGTYILHIRTEEQIITKKVNVVK